MPPSNRGASASSSPKRLLVALAAVALLGAAGYFWLSGDAETPPSPSLAQQPPARSTMIVLFQTDPPGGLVSLDGRTIGIAPLTLAAVPLGEHEVKATLEGRRETTQTVTISAEGENAVVMVVLPEAPRDAVPPGEGAR